MKRNILQRLVGLILAGLVVLPAVQAAPVRARQTIRLRAKTVPAAKRNSSVPLDGDQELDVPLGTAITWSADVSNSNDGNLWYRFRVTGPDGVQRLIRDFGPDTDLSWTSIEAEGFWEMELTARNLDTSEITVDVTHFNFVPLATSDPVITPTTNPLVMIYSGLACPLGSAMKVEYQGPSGNTEETPAKACTGATMNFYVGGLRKLSNYTMRQVVMDASGKRTNGNALLGQSGDPTYQFAELTVATPAPANTPKPVILYSSLFEPIHASDLDGNIIWYYLSQLSTATRADGNGTFWGFGENANLGPDSQLIRKFDLAGSTLLETNAARVNEQLTAMGMQNITGFHHDVRTLPNGTILAMAAVERILNGVQGDGDVDVLGDMILVLSGDLQVLWSWNSFDHLDPGRAAILGEQCGPNGAGCAPFYQSPMANDWTHGNALQLTADGNILYSARHQDWVIKIDYENGGGNGDILWRLGSGGDFSITSNDPNPWFSHQHDANFDVSDPTMFYVFDNGNTRQFADPSAHSRGQVYQIDEQGRTATPILNVDLGDFSLALGSASKLPNGDYHFDMGWIQQSYGPTSRVVEVNPAGQIVFEIDAPTAFYRATRLPSIYSN